MSQPTGLAKKLTAAALIASTALLTACGTGGSGSGTSSSSSRKADTNGMYRVKSGDTLSLIARANGVSYTDIMRWNNLTDPNRIEVGWRLRVRPNGSTSTASNTSSSSKSSPNSINDDTGSNVSVNQNTEHNLNINPELQNNIDWTWPVAGAILVRFNGSSSKGLVLDGAESDPVMAAASGEVIYAGNSLKGYGNMVVIKHSETWSTVYANNSALLVQVGARVRKGQMIAKMGSSGAQRVQLYFETRLNSKPVDPMKIMPPRVQ